MFRLIPLIVLLVGCVAAPPPPAKIAAPAEPQREPPARATEAPAARPVVEAPPAAVPPPSCPAQLGRVTVTADRLELAEPIYFAVGQATVKEESLPLLEEIAVVLAECAHVTVEVQVHTDPRGSSTWNYWLSHDRARAIQRALIERGVAESRLGYQGFGESCPINSEHPDPAARMRLLRRTELVRTDTGLGGGCPPPEPPPMPERYELQRD